METLEYMTKKAAWLLVVVVLLTVSGCARRSPSLCPIDGSPAQVTRRIDEKMCAYSHFSIVERTTHSWVADFQK